LSKCEGELNKGWFSWLFWHLPITFRF
jgi:hypothetical protein